MVVNDSWQGLADCKQALDAVFDMIYRVYILYHN